MTKLEPTVKPMVLDPTRDSTRRSSRIVVYNRGCCGYQSSRRVDASVAKIIPSVLREGRLENNEKRIEFEGRSRGHEIMGEIIKEMMDV